MADGTTKAIEDVVIGDLVLASDPETGEVSARTVTAEIRGGGEKELVAVGVPSTTDAAASEDLSDKPLVATAGHPFWVDNTLTWTEAGELAPGDLLVSQVGDTVQVTSLSQITEYARVYNLTVEGPTRTMCWRGLRRYSFTTRVVRVTRKEGSRPVRMQILLVDG
ncbi:hypothetical protein GCM10027160_12120 [Streptomyces calidiresistens]|uniref:Hint domain-containing protein n=1 Tax=Streptomyces calidiresistens TaxID=1485586 RepID=A0A7W3T0F7_9ACTN|nr:polymorphic toxin-type HINT domain-containing protein [Streptomyces calidiresistens]MBB0228704.1 hypothetical protein [Streptomyces calidiresistens]